MYQLKGDGNCFYRAFGFAYVRSLSLSQDRASQLRTSQLLESTLTLLASNGMDEDIIKDFFEPFQNLVHRATGFHDASSVLSQQDLLESFNDPETSNSILNATEYEPFLISLNETCPMSMNDFCAQEVESFGKDADHLQITALCRALNTSLDVVYLDGQQVSATNLDPMASSSHGKVTQSIELHPCNIISFSDKKSTHYIGSLLYRPGHYDLLTMKP
ncbi:ubiquitinyl hydrolase 1 [Malassezia caprae]|uniref:ubiquitinyl hydrolase 1 n=1 Tax=Malassezia caprae TaxID=1381934 RepID=A0AAF0E689_9BASI|nr:ubiquitinyl hydrolase 1 [Malassezia caprae]